MIIPDFKNKVKVNLEKNFMRLSERNPKVTIVGKGKMGKKEERPCCLS